MCVCVFGDGDVCVHVGSGVTERLREFGHVSGLVKNVSGSQCNLTV